MDIPKPDDNPPQHEKGNGHLFTGHQDFQKVPSKEEPYFTIRFTPRALERTVLILIILVLATGYFYNPFAEPEVTGMQTLETEQPAPPEPVETVTEPAVAPTPEVIPEENATVSPTADEPLEAAPEEDAQASVENETIDCQVDPDLVTLSIDKVITEQQSEYYGKLKQIKFTIQNKGCLLKPLIKAYIWDDYWLELDSTTQHKLATKQQGDNWQLESGIPTGEEKDFTMDLPVMFSELDVEKAVTLKLYDSDTSRLMGEATERFAILD